MNPAASETSPQLRTTHAWLTAFNALDFVEVGKFLTEDYEHCILPASMGRPTMKKQVWLKFITGAMKSMFDKFRVSYFFAKLWEPEKLISKQAEIIETIESPGKVVLHVCQP